MNYKTMSDWMLLRRIGKKDHAAYGEFLRRHEPYMAKVCRVTVAGADTREYGLQRARLRVWQCAAQFEGRAQVRTWLHILVKNECLQELKFEGRHHRQRMSLEGLPEDLPERVTHITPEVIFLVREKAARVRHAISRLQFGRQAMELFYLEERSVPEASALMRCTPYATKSRVNRGRQELRRSIFFCGIE